MVSNSNPHTSLKTNVPANQLEPDEGKDSRNGWTQVLEFGHGVRDKSVESAEAEYREPVRREGEERIRRHAKDSRHRVDGEENVGKLDAAEGRELKRGGERTGIRDQP